MANAGALPAAIPQAGAITYTTSHTSDGKVVYHPYKAVPATYQTPSGAVSGIQWIPMDPTPIMPAGGVPAGTDFAASWARGGSEMTKEQEKQHKEWQRSEEKRRKKEESSARGSLAQMQQRSQSTSAVPTAASYASAYVPAPTSPYAPPVGGFSPESKRKSYVGGAGGYPGSATNIYASTGRPRSPFAPGAGQDTNGPPRSPYAAQAPIPRSPYAGAGVLAGERPKSPYYAGAAAAERPKSPYYGGMGGGPAGGIYSSATAGVERPRSPYAPAPLSLSGDKPRTPIPGSPSGLGLGQLPQGQTGFASYAQPYGQTPGAGDLERKFCEMQPFERERRVSASVPPHTSYATYTPTSASQAPRPHSRGPSGSFTNSPVVGPSGVYVYPRGHTMEGHPVPGMPPPPPGVSVGTSYNGGGAGHSSERGGMGTIMGGVPVPFPASHGALPHSQAASPLLGGGGLPGGEYGHGHGATNGLEPRFSEPEGFSRPINAAQSYLPFDAMRITHLDDLTTGRALPKMPLVLQMHDVYPEDWSRLITDLALAWAGRLPTAPSANGAAVHRATLSADLIDLWNNSFFSPRSVEMVLYRGRERRSGPPHLLGVKDIILPEGGSDDSESSGSDDDTDSEDGDNDDDPRFAGRKQGPYGVPGGYFANSEEERRARKREKQKEKKRLRKERRKRRKEAGRAWAVYLMYRPTSGAGVGGAAVPSVHHAAAHGHGHGHGHGRTPSQTYGAQGLAGRKSPAPPGGASSGNAMAGGHSPAAHAAPFIPPSPRPASAVAPLPYGQSQQGGSAYGQQPASYASGGGGQPYGSQPYGGQPYGSSQGSQPYGNQPYGAGQGSQPYGASQGQGQEQAYASGQAPATYTPVGTPAPMSGYASYGGYGKGY